jgi:hypothetical protein
VKADTTWELRDEYVVKRYGPNITHMARTLFDFHRRFLPCFIGVEVREEGEVNGVPMARVRLWK